MQALHGGGSQRRTNLAEMQKKAQQLRNTIQDTEARLKSLQAQQVGYQYLEQLALEISEAQREVEVRRQMLQKIMVVVRSVQQGGQAGTSMQAGL